jgi:NAD(P)-dependent dehydrogenase (short-subunit alcohol dehydrogenase family)
MKAMTAHPNRQQDQHFVVTGAGSGIGRAIALRLAAEGANLSLFARREAPLLETQREAREHGAQVFVRSCDVRDRAQVDESFAAAAEQLGPMRGVIANAGIGGVNQPGHDDRFDDLVAVNLTGSYNCLRATQRHLGPGPGVRHMVLMSSILGRIGVPGYTGYCASKTALLGLARAMAMELAGDNIQVNALCPGWVDTEMAWDGLRGLGAALGVSAQEAHGVAMADVPLGKMSSPEQIAGMVAWLLSEDAHGVTGQGVNINNGAYMI